MSAVLFSYEILIVVFTKQPHQLPGVKLGNSMTTRTTGFALGTTYNTQAKLEKKTFFYWSYRESNLGPPHSMPVMQTVRPPRP